MRRLLWACFALAVFPQCATPQWAPPRFASMADNKRDDFECDRDAMLRADARAKEHMVKLGDRWYPEEAYGTCLEGKGWTKAPPVSGCGEMRNRTYPASPAPDAR